MPILPHLANECFESLNQNDKIIWPEYEETLTKNETNIIVIQIDGKKRGLISVKQNLNEEDLMILVNKDKNLIKYLAEKEIKKKIYIKDKLMNIITKNK